MKFEAEFKHFNCRKSEFEYDVCEMNSIYQCNSLDEWMPVESIAKAVTTIHAELGRIIPRPISYHNDDIMTWSAQINYWTNTRVAGDLIGQDAHVTLLYYSIRDRVLTSFSDTARMCSENYMHAHGNAANGILEQIKSPTNGSANDNRVTE